MIAHNYTSSNGAEKPIVLCESTSRAAAKHAAACRNAHKAYLRTVYGFQPENDEYGVVLSASAHGSIIAIEIRFFTGSTKTYKGMFELPLHVFKIDGMPVTSTAAMENFVGHVVFVTVIGRYHFNGIELSNVLEIDLDHNIVNGKPERLSLEEAAE
jgi:hypothetical protein